MSTGSRSRFPGVTFSSKPSVGFTLCDALHRLLLLSFVSALLLGCGGSTEDQAGKSTPGAERSTPEAESQDASGDLDPAMSSPLKEKELQNYMAAMKDLKELGALADEKLGDDPSALRQMFTAVSFPSKWEAVLKKHGFDDDTFGQVHIRVAGALGALMSEETKKKFEEEKAERAKQMEQMKKALSPEQIAEMQESMEALQQQMFAMYDSVPKENIELVRKYRAQLEAVFGK